MRILVLLDIPTCSEEKLHAYISNIELRVDVWASAIHSAENRPSIDGSPTRDLIASANISKVDDPFTLVREHEGEVILQLVWEVRLDLARPRFRAQNQTVTFLPIATILGTKDEVENGDLLEPFSILEYNVLEPLRDLDGIKDYPYLPASRLEKFAPPPPKKDNKIRLRHVASSPLPAYAVAVPRLKYTKINTSMPQPSTIASLDIEMISVLDTDGEVETVDVSMANGKVMALMSDVLPISWRSKDCLSFLYDLQPAPSQAELMLSDASNPTLTANLNVDTLSISLVLKVKYSTQSTATIKMSWNATVDFSLALNPSFGAPSQPLQRTNRPSSLNFSPYPAPPKVQKGPHRITTSLTSTRTASTNLQHQIIPTAIPRSESSVVVVSFTAPTEPARINVPFSWKVIIMNNSLKTVKLAIVPLPRIQRPTNTTQQLAKRHAPKSSNASLPPASKLAGQASKGHNRNALSTAKAVVDEQVLYALHHQTASAAPSDVDLVSLTAELRIGPLSTGQCYETEIQFVAYKSGLFSVDAVRVVDLVKEAEGGVGMINDIRELPEIFVVNDSE